MDKPDEIPDSCIMPSLSFTTMEHAKESQSIFVETNDEKGQWGGCPEGCIWLNAYAARSHFVNLLIVLLIMFVYLAFLPVIISFINSYAIVAINGCPSTTVPTCPANWTTPTAGFTADQPTKDLLTAIIQLFPLVLAVMILASGLFYAVPRPER